MNRGARFFTVVLGLCALGCGVAAAGETVRVGARVISTSDLDLRRRVEQAYQTDRQVTTATAALILIHEALAGEVGRGLGVDATTTECEGLARYADSTSQAPELLVNVKAVFGGDRLAYLRLYIAPKVVEQKLRGYFVHSRELHKEQIRSIEAAFGEARGTSNTTTGGSTGRMPVPQLQPLAARYKLEYTTFTLSESETSAPQGLPVNLEFRQDPLLELVRPLKPGDIYGNIIENDEEFRIARLISHEGSTTHTLEALVARKRSYDEWYREQAAKLPIVFFNNELAGEIRKAYPPLPWWPQVTIKEEKNK